MTVRTQIECEYCHTTRALANKGATDYFWRIPENWITTFHDDGSQTHFCSTTCLYTQELEDRIEALEEKLEKRNQQ